MFEPQTLNTPPEPTKVYKMKEQFIHVPYGKSVHGQEEMEAVKKVLRTSTQMGPRVREMEENIATLFDKKFGLMVNSGTSALYLSFEVLDLLQPAWNVRLCCGDGRPCRVWLRLAPVSPSAARERHDVRSRDETSRQRTGRASG